MAGTCKDKIVANLITASPTNKCSVLHSSPKAIPCFQELWKQLPPVITKRPGENFIFVVFFIFFHIVS